MEPNEFKPALTLEEANERLRAVEHALADERERIRHMTPITPEEMQRLRRELERDDWIDGHELVARIVAECEAADGQH